MTRRLGGLMLLLLLAACGGGGDDNATTGPSEQFVTVPDETTTSAGGATTTTSATGGVVTSIGGAASTVLRPASASSNTPEAPPGVDASGARVTYSPANLIDANATTAWRVPGDGRGVVVTLHFPDAVRVTSLGFVTGYAKTDTTDGTDRFRQNRRVLRIIALFDDGSQEIRLADTREMQRFPISRDHSTVEINIEIVETTGNPERDFTAISEIEVLGTAA
jgi:hypothetical protein